MRLLARLGTFVLAFPLLLAAACSGEAASDDASTAMPSADGGPRDDAAFPPLDAALDAVPPVSDGGVDAPFDPTIAVVGTAHAVADGVALPLFPFSVLPAEDRVYVVGEARSDIAWGDETFPHGGFILAIDAHTGDLLYYRGLGRGSSVDAIAHLESDLVVAGSFTHPTTFTPSAGDPIELTSVGASDAFVARMTHDGTFIWAESFGSPNHDGAFSVHTGDRGLLVAGYARGDITACGGTLRAHPGVVDPMEGRLLGTQDALLLHMTPAGDCTDAAVIGAPGADDFALRLAATDEAIYLSGEGGGPLTLRTVAGDEKDLGGDAGGWLLRLADDGGADLWTALGHGSRGRGLGIADDHLFWTFRASGLDLLHGEDVVATPADGAHLLRLSLRDDTALTWSLGRRTTDTISLAISTAGVVAPATGHDPSHVRIAFLQDDALSTFRSDASTSYPYVVAAEGQTIWMAGQSGLSSLTLGPDDIPIELGVQGGFFLVRLDP
jgi:hypothetical protein